MQKHRYKTSFIITALLYISSAYGIWYGLKSFTTKPQKVQTTKAITLSLSDFKSKPTIKKPTPQPKPIEETLSQKEQLQEDEQKEEIKTITKPKLKEETKKEKIEKKPTIKPIEKKLIKRDSNFKVATKKHHKSKKTKRKKHTKHKRVLKSQASKHHSNKKAKATLLSTIRYKINHAKIYPKAAKRRRIQGKVYAKFRVLKNGQVSNIKLSGSSIFFNATKKAIQKAFPIHTKDSKKVLPLDISITLRYNLTNN